MLDLGIKTLATKTGHTMRHENKNIYILQKKKQIINIVKIIKTHKHL